jgi:putative inorganic carbon (HCO3(-)) transporter
VRRFASAVANFELILLGLATPLLLFPGIWTPLGVALIALTWGCRRLASGRFSVSTAMDLPIVVLLVMAVVSLIPSVALDLSLNRCCIYVLGVSLFYGMANGLHTERHIHYMGIALVLLGLVVALVSLLGTDWETGVLIRMPAIYGRLPGPIIRGLPGSGVIEEYDLVNPRVVAGALAILLPVPLAYLAFGQGRRLRLLSGCAVLVMTAVLLLTQAPQGLLGLAAVVFLLGVWWSRWLLLTIPLALGGGLAFWQLLRGDWLSPETIDALNFGLYSRVVNGARGVAMVRDMAYTGIGLNTFPILDGLYSGGGGHAAHAHNVLIQTAVDLGLPGLMAVLALLAGFGYTVARAWRGSLTRNQRALLTGICGVVVAWLAYGLLDSITLGHKPGMAVWVGLALAAATRLQVEQPMRQASSLRIRLSRKRCMMVLLSLFLLLVVVGLAAHQTIGAFYLNLGVMEAHRALASADSPGDAVHHLDAATLYLRQSTHWDRGDTRAYRLLDWIDSLDGNVESKRWPRDAADFEAWKSVFGS